MTAHYEEAAADELLIRGMVGEEHRDLYLNNAEFHATIEQLARFVIPDLVAGVAARCTKSRAELENVYRKLMTAPFVLREAEEPTP